MTSKEDIAKQIASRIQADIKHHGGSLPERYALAWHGYVAGLYEWGLIDHYDYIIELLPKIETLNPILEIFEGRDDE